MSEYHKVRLAVSHGPDLHFEGKVLHEFTTQNRAGSKSRWTELRLWETRGGSLIPESVGCSAHEREGEIRQAVVIKPVGQDFLPREQVTAVMEAFGWTTASKAFAREMGWDVVQRVD